MSKSEVGRADIWRELRAARQENHLQYVAIAEFMGRIDACVTANASRLNEHEDDIRGLKILSGLAAAAGAVAGTIGGIISGNR